MAHIRTLSSNEFQGRGPGTKGEDVTLAYLQNSIATRGLSQGTRTEPTCKRCRLWARAPIRRWPSLLPGIGKTMQLGFEKDFVAQTRRTVDAVHLTRT